MWSANGPYFLEYRHNRPIFATQKTAHRNLCKPFRFIQRRAWLIVSMLVIFHCPSTARTTKSAWYWFVRW